MAKFTVTSGKEAGTLVARLTLRKNTRFLETTWSELVDQTPVDTGTARYSWIFSVVRPSRKKPAYKIYPRPKPPEIWKYTFRWLNWYIVNNQEYIERLNNGWSQQNTQIDWVGSTVRRNVAKFNSGAF